MHRGDCDATIRCMKQLTIQLADAEGVVLEERTIDGDFASIDDYVATLCDAEGEERARQRLDALLLEGLEGEPVEATEAFWDELRRSVAEDDQTEQGAGTASGTSRVGGDRSLVS